MKDKAQDESISAAQRLCSEIQLFDLCELDACSFKRNRFCTNQELLEKFESIKEEDDRQAILYEEESDDEGEIDSDFNDFNDFDDSFKADEEQN